MLHQRGLKSITRLLLIPVMMKMRWTNYLKALSVRLIDSSMVKTTNCIKIPLDYIMGLN